MNSRFWKTLTAALLAAVQVFAGVAGTATGAVLNLNAGKSGVAMITAAAEMDAAPCDMSCCRVASCWCEVAPVRTPARPAPAIPPVPPVESKLSAPLPAEDLVSLTLALLEPERKAPVAPPTEVIVHAPEAPLFALHCSWLI